MTTRVLLLALLVGLLLVACQGQTAPDAAAPDAREGSPTVVATAGVLPIPTETVTATALPDREVRLLTPPPSTPEPIVTLEKLMPVTGQVPQDLLKQMVDDLSERLGVSAGAIVVQRAEAVVWRDGSLGCPQPGRNYTQALVNGYRVTLAAGDQVYHYHASDSGYFFLCEHRASRGDAPPTQSSDR